ncbi:MAG: asparagine synthase (glutamine-hydrolyzing) [Terriglobia bacterium]
MCGIAGIFQTHPDAHVDTMTVHRMCQTIIHRGPDDEGIFTQGPVGLGMRRLSIIDLAGGHQPIHNEDRTIWVVFNGEIYNFPGLRQELEERGHRFYTNTDTEVIAHLFEDHGADCVKKLRGMFAFAVYDLEHRRLFLARDRLGIKPLHYAFVNGTLYFGSEIKAILAAAPELKEVDPQALLAYFCYGYIPDPETAFKSIHKLPPGHVIELAGGKLRLDRYWDLPPYGAHTPRSEEECLEELEERLAEAVRIRLISDVPLGALLSGGVDSSVVVALMARASSRPVKTFSIGFSKQDFNESAYARRVAERFHTEHHELIVEPDISGTLEALTHGLEEPFADSSMIPTYHVSRLARQHVTVALSGDGGDELFAGYDRYSVHLRRQASRMVPRWAGRAYRNHVYPRLPGRFRGRKFLYNVSLPPPERYLDSISVLPVDHRESNLFSSQFREAARHYGDPAARFRDYLTNAPAHDPLSRLLYLDTKTYLVADILTKVDRMSMASSLEARVPILDHVFVEYVTSLPVSWKLRNGEKKYIFKKLAERVGVPADVLYRPKQGFALPLVHWLRKEFKEDLLRLLLEPRAVQRGYFDPRAIRAVIDEHLESYRDHTATLWALLIFELWHRNFLEQAEVMPPAVPWMEAYEVAARPGA